jgi:hypothetical protein
MDPYPSLARHPYGRSDSYAGTIRMDTDPADVEQPPEDLRGPGLSFERDIQPLSKKYFARAFGSIRNPHRAAAAFAEADAGLKGAYVQNAQIRALDEQSRARRIGYETAVYTLESARDKARKEREMLANLAPLQSELDSVLNNPNLDTDGQHRVLGQLGIRYAGVLATNPAANAAFRAAQSGVRDSEKRFTAAHYLNAGGPPEYLKELEDRWGRSLTAADELPFTEAAERIQAGRLSTAELRAKRSADAKALDRRESGREKALDSVERIRWAKDPMDPAKTLDVLADPGDELVLDSIIDDFAFPEEKKKVTTLRDKHALAKRIRSERLADPDRRPLRSRATSAYDSTVGAFR